MTSRGHRRFVALAVLAAYALALPSRAAEPKPDDDVTARDAAIVMRWTAAWNILVWPAGSAISGCFLERDGEWRATLVKAASAWSEIANIRFDFGLAPGYRTCSLFEPSDIRVTFRPGLASSSHKSKKRLRPGRKSSRPCACRTTSANTANW